MVETIYDVDDAFCTEIRALAASNGGTNNNREYQDGACCQLVLLQTFDDFYDLTLQSSQVDDAAFVDHAEAEEFLRNAQKHSKERSKMHAIPKPVLHVVHVGDCMTYVWRRDVETGLLSSTRVNRDHSTDFPGEKERILAAGGDVKRRWNWAVPRASHPESPWNLEPTHVVGDEFLKSKRVLVADPEVAQLDLDDDVEFVVCSSDGLPPLQAWRGRNTFNHPHNQLDHNGVKVPSSYAAPVPPAGVVRSTAFAAFAMRKEIQTPRRNDPDAYYTDDLSCIVMRLVWAGSELDSRVYT